VSQAGRIKLVVSDVDGTLVTPDKELKPATIAAAQKLKNAGIGLALVSSRPPRGMTFLMPELGLDGPFAAFNGGMVFSRAGEIAARRTVDPDAAREAAIYLAGQGVDVWLFTDETWYLTDPDGPYVPREKRTVRFDPTRIDDFTPYFAHVGKIVGSTRDFDLLERCEGELQTRIGTAANARRSQAYYLDVTPLGADKGDAIAALADTFGVPLSEVAALGDMSNDVPMFRRAGLAIAMGNATEPVKAEAHCTTKSNVEDGWAAAVDEFILPRA
jgi:Cof subfamily protein (haloacid dehalogenase superfamily)